MPRHPMEHGIETRRRMLNFIVAYTMKHPFAPSIREIMEGVGLKTTSNIPYHLRILQREGLIEREKSIGRGIRVPDSVVRDRFDVFYICHYPTIGGCGEYSTQPGNCPLHGSEMIMTVQWKT